MIATNPIATTADHLQPVLGSQQEKAGSLAAPARSTFELAPCYRARNTRSSPLRSDSTFIVLRAGDFCKASAAFALALAVARHHSAYH
jgi:hypothetical protein